MAFKMNLIVTMAIVVSQVSTLSALDVNYTSEHASVNNKTNSVLTDQNNDILHKIDALINCSTIFYERIARNGKFIIPYAALDFKCSGMNSSSSSESGLEPSTTAGKLQELEDQLKKLIDTVEDMKNLEGVSEELKKRLSALEESLRRLYELFDEENKKHIEESENVKEILQHLTAQINFLTEEVASLKKSINENQKEQKQKRLTEEIIFYIKSQNYPHALQKFGELVGDIQHNVNYIVHEVYNNHPGNFVMLLQFGDTSRNTTLSLAIYRALDFEMESIEEKNYITKLRLIQSVQSNVIDGKGTTAPELEDAKKLKIKIRNVASNIMVPQLSDALVHNKYDKVSEMLENIYISDPPLFNDVFKSALHLKFDQISYTDKLFEYFKTHKHKDQSILGYSAIILELKSRKDMNQPVVVNLAFAVKRLLAECSFCNEAVQEANRMKDELPLSVRNLVFSKYVCFYSVVNNEYLYAANDYFKYDRDSRTVFSWIPGNQVREGDWKIEPEDNQIFPGTYLIRNMWYDEFLLITAEKYTSQRRYVFTRKSTIFLHLDPMHHWIFEPSGDYMYILNIGNVEYLLADDQIKYDNDRRRVWTWTTGRKTGDSLWSIVVC